MRPARRSSWRTARLSGAGLALLLVLVGALGAVVASLPARYADLAVAQLTHSRVRLAQAEGSVWNGSARLVLASGAGDEVSAGGSLASGPDADHRVLAGVAIPGRISWVLRRLPLLAGRIDLQLQLDSAARALRVQGDRREIRIDAGTIELPAVELGRLGSPWNTVRPAGALSVGWDNLVVRGVGFAGRAWIELRDVSSSLTPVRPLGSYRVDLDGGGIDANRPIGLQMTTIDGPLLLQGSGDFTSARGLRFVAEARARAAEDQRLQSFLGLLGERRGETTIIRIGA